MLHPRLLVIALRRLPGIGKLFRGGQRSKPPKYIYAFLAGVVVASGIWLWGLSRLWDGGAAETKTIYVDRETPRRIRKPFLPDRRYIYLPVRDTIRISLPVPRGLRVRGVLDHRFPVYSRRGRLYVPYWNPDSLRYEEEAYALPRRRWAVWVDAGGGFDTQPFVSVRATVRIKRTTGYIGPSIGPGGRSWEFGLRYRIIGFGH